MTTPAPAFRSQHLSPACRTGHVDDPVPGQGGAVGSPATIPSVAQLDRAGSFYLPCCGFESYRAGQAPSAPGNARDLSTSLNRCTQDAAAPTAGASPPRRAFPQVAALFVQTDGSYYGLPGVDPWDEARDARTYTGPLPVIAHPPCQRWGKMWAGQPLWIKRTGQRKRKGDDGGCFAAALDAVRRWGGVLEHPAGSHAWTHFGLQKPPRKGGWIIADDYGWTCCVEQGRYGHYARKPTWLYAVGCRLPQLDWGHSAPQFPAWAIERHGLAYCKRAGELAFQGGGTDSAPRIGTPEPFRDVLLSMARTARRAIPWHEGFAHGD